MDVSEPLIQCENVSFHYGSHAVLHDVDLSLSGGERLGIMGPIGSGKTTLLHLLVGLLKPSSGRVNVLGVERRSEEDFAEVRRKVGLVFQDPDDQLFCPTVIEDVAFGPLNLGYTIEEARLASREALEQVGLAGFEDRVTYKMSGGEKRLVALATVLAMKPDVLLLDEPTASLDKAALERITSTLSCLPQSMIVVSHEPSFLSRLATRRAELVDGTIRVQ
jgi:cobalt/nickel transport system ATP-binding protein